MKLTWLNNIIIFISIDLVFPLIQISAQEVSITGKVINILELPVKDCAVFINDGTLMTFTDDSGRFSLTGNLSDISLAEKNFRPYINSQGLNFRTNKKGDVSLHVFDVTGCKIGSWSENDLPEGMHTVSLLSNLFSNTESRGFCFIRGEMNGRSLLFTIPYYPGFHTSGNSTGSKGEKSYYSGKKKQLTETTDSIYFEAENYTKLSLSLDLYSTDLGSVLLKRRAGAVTPFITYDCDDQAVFTYGNGASTVTNYYRLTSEAINKKCVKLNITGSYIEFTAVKRANSLNLRYSLPFNIPRDQTRTLSVYVSNEFAGNLILSTYYMHADRGITTDNTFHPADPSMSESQLWRWWENSAIMNINIAAGDVIRIRKDAKDSASVYYLDLVDLELVPSPLGNNGQKPDASWKSVTDYGATPDNPNDDDYTAFVNCINAASSGNKKVWMPPGQYNINRHIVLNSSQNGLTIQGAGMWYTTVFMATFHGITSDAHGVFWVDASDVTFRDFKVEKTANYRRIPELPDTHGGPAFKKDGDRLRIENVWITHSGTGSWYGGNYGVFINNRVWDNYADGLNLEPGASHCLIWNNHFRGNGDDNVVHLNTSGSGKSNKMSYNTIEGGYFGRGMNLNCASYDTLEYNLEIDHSSIGLLLGAYKTSSNTLNNCLVRGNVIMRCGEQGIFIRPDNLSIQVTIEDNWIIDPVGDGIYIRSGNTVNANIKNNVIRKSGGILINDVSSTGSVINLQGNILLQ